MREALDLELDGRLTEALDRYRSALVSEPALAQDVGASQDLTVRVLSKAAHLCLDLGYGEEASDFVSRMTVSKNSRAQREAAAVRGRLARLQVGGRVVPTARRGSRSASLLPSAADALGVYGAGFRAYSAGCVQGLGQRAHPHRHAEGKGLVTADRRQGGRRQELPRSLRRQPPARQDRARLSAQGLLDKLESLFGGGRGAGK